MSTFPGSPKVLRGALVSVDLSSMKPTVIPLQYNPSTVSRSFEVASATGGGEAGQRRGPPIETIQVEIELDAADAATSEQGPELLAARVNAILGLIGPASVDVRANLALAAQGAIEILPPQAPIVLFVFGPRRVEPIQLTELSITEEAHDPALAPVRARVSLGMQVLRFADLSQTHPVHALSLANQMAREASARNLAASVATSQLGTALPTS